MASAASSSGQSSRIAIVNEKRCKPKKCNLECKKVCPSNRVGKLCIEVEKTSKISSISEALCIGCGICTRACPFDAIEIINLPSAAKQEDIIHRYGANSFELHRLPTPRPGEVLGLVGRNGTGKSSALQLLQGRILPNLGQWDTEPSQAAVLKHFRGSELQTYFNHLFSHPSVVLKPQYVDAVAKAVKGKVGELLAKKNASLELIKTLELQHLLDRDISVLSGGELQRLCICVTAASDAQTYMFDEPSSYLDIRQRLVAANVIRSLISQGKYVIAVEHDLSILDYLSDSICILYGKPSAYGIVTVPYGVREGINAFLDGKLPAENTRFRTESLSFKIASVISYEEEAENQSRSTNTPYPAFTKTLGDFQLQVAAGGFHTSEITVLLGENGCGKTTLVKLLAGILKPDEGEIPLLTVSYKPQTINPKFDGTVRQLLQSKVPTAFANAQFNSEVLKPLDMADLLDLEVKTLSGGELQRAAIVLCLGKPADIYLLDEPSAYLDAEQRVTASRVIKRFILHSQKTAFVVEHDFIMATYLADKVLLFSGTPGRQCSCAAPQALVPGMNAFLKQLGVTFRRDPVNFRPRINKLNSVLDQEQKTSGTYFYHTVDDRQISV